MLVKIKKLHSKFNLSKGTEESSCFDVVATNISVKGKFATVHLGFSTEIELGYKGVIVPRSSFTQKGWVMQNSPGQIDSDYRGEWIIKFEAIQLKIISDLFKTDEEFYPEFPYKVGERVAQIYFEKVQPFTIEYVEELSYTQRDAGGFGSTGK